MKRLIPFAALLCLPLAVVGCSPEVDVDADPVDPIAPVDPIEGGSGLESGSAIESGSSVSLDSEYSAQLASYEGEVTFSVPDMHCEFACAPKVERTLADIAGVSDVKTDVSTQTVSFKVNKGFDYEAAMRQLAENNYPVAGVKTI